MGCLKDDVRILLIGDPDVGKTSLIFSLVSETFAEHVPYKAEEILIPADVTPENVPTHIIDFSAIEQNDNDLEQEVLKASVICVVYSVYDEDSIQRLTTYWLPFLRNLLGEEHRTPVILVGNKADLADYPTLETILPIMNDFSEVETCVECSAKTMKNITEVFYYAQKAVLHPTAPIYNADNRELTLMAKKVLSRIFKICDLDNDSVLNDKEINLFQQKSFNTPLHSQDLDDVKMIIARHTPDGILNNGISLKGFLFLHTLFIQKGKHETVWTILRKFGYNDDLQLTGDFIAPRVHVGPGCTAELTCHGMHFFSHLFNKYDEDKDGFLSPLELHNLFQLCPYLPWGPGVNNTVLTNTDGWISLSGFLSQWTLTTLLDLPRTLELLAYFGYHYQLDSQQTSAAAVHVTQDKKMDIQKRQSSRNVFRCYVAGAKSVGKTSFLQGLLGRNLRYMATLDRQHLSNFTISKLRVYGQEKYLVLKEIDVSTSEVMSVTEVDCDVISLLYDVTNPVSFGYCASLFLKHFVGLKIPLLIVGCKAEHSQVRQDYELSPAQFCQNHRLPPPQFFTCMDAINTDVYTRLAILAAYPNLKRLVNMLFIKHNPLWMELKLRHIQDLCMSGSKLYLKLGVGVISLLTLSFIIYRCRSMK